MSGGRGIGFSASVWFDVVLRISLAVLFLELEDVEPFTRKIHEEELWLYKNPITPSYVPSSVLWPMVLTAPVIVICVMFIIYKDKVDCYQAILSLTLALGFNGIITDMIKLIVGRPRPDFFWRCFPDGRINMDFDCTGDPLMIKDGKKSFPSGHSSFAFTSFGFIAFYTAGKLHIFGIAGKAQSWRLCLFFIPICIALVIALSRTCDYHHHWQDVVVGSSIGCFLAYTCYRHYYPPLDSQVSHKPYTLITSQAQIEDTRRIGQTKWI